MAEPSVTPRRSQDALTVSAVNRLAREHIEQGLPPVWITGEVSGWKQYASGHCYFTLKDRDAQLRCVMYRSDAQRLPALPTNGMSVRVIGGLTLYEKRGEFQLVARRMAADGGDGLWRIAFEKLRARLDREGLLAAERKRPLPRCPTTVGVVTSPLGAVLHDILHTIERRAPWTRVVFSPARVQGDGAALEIAAAVRLFTRARVADVLIVGRGGGSVEDLWPFNEEPVARAIAESPIPVISAVGHETDVTIADLVADRRAPTPSVAAEMAVLDGATLRRELAALEHRLRTGLRAPTMHRRRRVEYLGERLRERMRRGVRERSSRLQALAGRLDALSPLAALGRGYAVPLDGDGHVLRTRDEFGPGMPFELRVSDGRVPCRVDEQVEER